uniref:Mitochondrial phosphate carrier protein 1 isoform X1 n=1 Tax=Rhizophora mucronata TaxID=61149 RepID=A0A2P2J4F9_RHIMU
MLSAAATLLVACRSIPSSITAHTPASPLYFESKALPPFGEAGPPSSSVMVLKVAADLYYTSTSSPFTLTYCLITTPLVFANLALCPFEAIKIRVQARPRFAHGLHDGFPKLHSTEGLLG